MHILYYIEPNYEFDNSLFRFPTLKAIIIPQIKQLYNYNNTVSFTIILNEKTAEHLLKEAEIPEYIKFLTINDTTLTNIIHTNKEDYYKDLYDNHSRLSDYYNFLTKKLQVFPDLIVNYESTASNFLRANFSCPVLDMMFGVFSRLPFPGTTFYSLNGIYKNSDITKLKNININAEEQESLRQIRKIILETYSQTNCFKTFINGLRFKYKKIILLACQVDNYFAFNYCSNYKTQLEFVNSIGKNIPEDICLLVTTHGEYVKPFQNEFVNQENIVILDTNIPYASQELSILVDGIVCVSSSVGYLASLWRKPLFIAGKSHLNVLSTSDNFDDFLNKVYSSTEENKDGLLLQILTKYTYIDKFTTFNGEWLFKFFNNIIQNKKINHQINSNQFLQQFKEAYKEKQYFKLLKDKKIQCNVDFALKNIVEKDFVSYDIFDTLVVRPFIEPWNLFYTIEEDVRKIVCEHNFPFVDYRRQAEAEARRDNGGELEVNLDDIYNKFIDMTGLSLEQVSLIKELEFQAELKYCMPRQSLLFYYNLSKLTAKCVSIITDIYLYKYQIEKILDKCLIFGYNKLYVSAEERIRKHNSLLYKKYIADLNKDFSNIKVQQCIHIGDNIIADGKMCDVHGIQRFIINKCIDNYIKSSVNEYLPANIGYVGLSGSFLVGLFAIKFYDSPYNIKRESVFLGNKFLFGYQALGPLVLGFLQWLKNNVKNSDYSHIYFLARDGWILKKSWDILFNTIKSSSYLYLSRRCASVPSISNINEIYEIGFQAFSPRPLSEWLDSRFGISTQDDDVKLILKKHNLQENQIISGTKHRNKLSCFLKDLEPIILKSAEKESKNLKKYLEVMNFQNNLTKGKIAFVDLGYKGSMQYFVSKIFNTNNIDGFYFLTHFYSRNLLKPAKSQGFFKTGDDHKAIKLMHDLNKHVFLFETLFSSPEGSITSFDESLNKNYIYSDNEDLRIEFLKQIHAGCLSFIKDFSCFGNISDVIELTSELSQCMLLKYANYPKVTDAQMMLNIGVENIYGGGSVCLICDSSNNINLNKVEIDYLIKNSKWKEGAIAIYKQYNKAIINTAQNIETKPSFDKKTSLLNKLERSPYLYCRDSSNIILSKICAPLVINRSSFFTQTLVKIIKYFVNKK